MASLQQRAPAAVACPTGRPSRMSSVAAASSSSTGLRSAAPARRQGGAARRTAALEVACSLNNSTGTVAPKPTKLEAREQLRLALPSKGRMAEDTLQLLKDCQLSVVKPNPRQYVARISQMPGMEVWFQRATDVVRKIVYGDVDLGIVGLDMLAEIGNDDPDIVILHDALDFGQCHLALGVPSGGKYADVNTLDDLRAMPWSEQTPLRVVTGYQNIARKYFAEKGFEHVVLLSADGALEAAPAMGSADIILDLVSTGVTLRENNLKQLEGGTIMQSQGALVANRRALLERKGLLEVCHELIERLEAHLTADKYYSVIANMRGESAEEVSLRLLALPGLAGLSGPTVSPVYTLNGGGAAEPHFFAATICVPKKQLYPAVKEIRRVGGSGVLVQPMTYIFDEEPARWRQLLENLGLSPDAVNIS
ncbi:ATP phosphoribosyltransferase [Micractinium conductrix]|uniref:ATP phosphoribosyltransferase n=1 Tax=Micractinium conductrix TaxID=554055 RepID=A0A2P6VL36_9CHLO|nr:ATP phosphoribosyltransferase [Micractinium conductrix]|eukprot:PSC74780.1 ATP phosphoribosyltransferase [Micractinium conductrix]